VLSGRLKVVNRQLKDAHRQLDRLCGFLAEPTESAARRCDPRIPARKRSDRPRHAAR
jgi:hypothetical protein